MNGWQIAGLAAVLLIGVFILFLYMLAAYVAKPRVQTSEETREWLKQNGFWRGCDAMEKEELIISAYDGYALHATYIPAQQPGERYVIISHGYTSNRMGSLKYVHLFRGLGYNCLIYDNRGHGDNGRAVCTMGKKEYRDLLAVIAYVYGRFGDDIYLGLHGESLGAALQIMALRERPKVKFIVNDCGFARLIDVTTHNVHDMFHLPRWVCYPASAASRFFFGFSHTELNPIEALKGNTVPICFVHGAGDDFIPCTHSEQMRDMTAGYSKLRLFEGAGHAQSIERDEAGYREMVRCFLEEIGAQGVGMAEEAGAGKAVCRGGRI